MLIFSTGPGEGFGSNLRIVVSGPRFFLCHSMFFLTSARQEPLKFCII